jgi:basic membrane protein A and related proteins
LHVSSRLVALGAASAILVGACGGGAASPSASAYKACVAFDVGGLGDKGFNDLAKLGLDNAGAAGYATAYTEAKASTDYAANIQRLIDQNCKTIIAVGFNQQVPAQTAALANPTIAFAQVDAVWDPSGPDGKLGTADDVKQPANFTGLDFQIDQAAMLAGYLAAGFSKTGIIGTYGGAQFAGVTRFMDGYYAGIAYYNKAKGTTVKLLGWDAAKQTGQFVGGDNPWGDATKGEQFAKNFVDQGADVVGPVAGATGNGSIKYMLSVNKWAIGVDTDQAVSLAAYAAAIITSAQKVIDVAVLDTIKTNAGGNLGGGNYEGTLANKGVGMAPLHNFDGQVSAGLKSEIQALSDAIVAGTVKVADYLK